MAEEAKAELAGSGCHKTLCLVRVMCFRGPGAPPADLSRSKVLAYSLARNLAVRWADRIAEFGVWCPGRIFLKEKASEAVRATRERLWCQGTLDQTLHLIVH